MACICWFLLHRPYSYLNPVSRFPQSVEVWSKSGEKSYQLADLPLADRIPVQGVRTGPRAFAWRPDQPASLVWAEAMDGGNPKEKVPHRDRILTLAAPFQAQPREVFETVERFTGMEPLAGSNALVSDYDRDKRWARTMEIAWNTPGASAPEGRVIFSRNVQDHWSRPRAVLLRWLLCRTGRKPSSSTATISILQAEGASPSGDHPFLDRYNLVTQKSERLFQSGSGRLRTVVAVLDPSGARLP